jgi:AcrR family transcriptional regulator
MAYALRVRRTVAPAAPRFTGGGGSNRDPRAHQAILDAAAALFEEIGYERVTMEAIARRADVGKPTLYRWWKNKAALAHEVMLSRAGDLSYVDTGDLEKDVRAFVRQTVQFFDVPLVQAAWPGAVADLRSDPEAWQLAYDTFTRPAAEHLRLLLDKATARGEARAGVDPTTVFDAITGACMSQINTPGRSRSRKHRVDALVDLLLAGVSA